jgi:hypothetical protein
MESPETTRKRNKKGLHLESELGKEHEIGKKAKKVKKDDNS